MLRKLLLFYLTPNSCGFLAKKDYLTPNYPPYNNSFLKKKFRKDFCLELIF